MYLIGPHVWNVIVGQTFLSYNNWTSCLFLQFHMHDCVLLQVMSVCLHMHVLSVFIEEVGGALRKGWISPFTHDSTVWGALPQRVYAEPRGYCPNHPSSDSHFLCSIALEMRPALNIIFIQDFFFRENKEVWLIFSSHRCRLLLLCCPNHRQQQWLPADELLSVVWVLWFQADPPLVSSCLASMRRRWRRSNMADDGGP